MNLSNYRIVKIGNKYAIRKGFIFHQYLDLQNPGLWWSKLSQYFNVCLTNDSNKIGDIYDLLVSPEEIIR